MVTPCVGVWIETVDYNSCNVLLRSHPAWVCGLKQKSHLKKEKALYVTPCVGVWIETTLASYN